MFDYESPITLYTQRINTEIEDTVMKMCEKYSIDVNKEELLKALKYDRDQYQKGFNDGKMSENISDDFASIMICAIRYALGRRTYMPSIVCNFVKQRIPNMSDKDLYVIIRDIKECRDYGDDCDKREWMSLLEAAKHECDVRGVEY